MNKGKIAGIGLMVGGGAALLAGLSCFFVHLSDGTLGAHAQECITQVLSGLAVFSPGLGALKVDR